MRTDLADYALPPFTDWQKFERFCCDLWAELWGNHNTKLNGRGGQKQAGVDVYGNRAVDGALCGVQCKRRGANGVDSGRISEKVLRAEVNKAKTFQPPLRGEFVLAYTGARDAVIQEVARSITEEHRTKGLFEVQVYSWDDLIERLGDHPEVWKKHFSSLIGAIRALDSIDADKDDLSSSELQESRGTHATGCITQVVATNASLLVEAEFREEIQLVTTLLEEGQPRIALTQAEALRKRIWTRANAETRAHILISIGHAHLAVGDTTRAASSLMEAADNAPESAEVCAHVALGHFLAGNMKAVRTWTSKALSQSPCHMMAIQLAISVDERTDEEILDEYDSLVGTRSEILAILGQRAAERGQLAKAREWLERAIQVGGSHPELFAGTAQVLVNLGAEETAKHIHQTRNTRAYLTRSIELLDRALSHVGDADSRRAKVNWYATRVVAKYNLRAPDAAAAADEAIVACGEVPELVRLRAAIASEVGDSEKVVTLLESLTEPLDIDDLSILAAALSNLERFDQAVRAFQDMLAHVDLPHHHWLQATVSSAILLQRQGRESDAVTLIEDAMKNASGALLPTIAAVRLYEHLGDLERRDKLLGVAIEVSAQGSTYALSMLGDALMRAERWADAADVYLKAIPEPVGDVYEPRLMRALSLSGRYASLLARCDRAEEAFGDSVLITEFRSAVYESLGDLDNATFVYRRFLDRSPESHAIRLRLAAVLFRQGRLGEVAQEIELMDFAAIHGVHGLSILAQTLAHLGRPQEAIEVAYRMRSEQSDHVEAHVRYVSLYTSVRHHLPDVAHVGVVALGQSVQLSGPGALGWVLLSDSGQGSVSEKEYPKTHDLSRLLVGRHVGDKIRLPSAGSEWEVAAIGSKYGFAMAQTLERFPAHFPTSTQLQQQTVPADREGMVEHFRKQFEVSEAWRATLLTEYRLGRCGVGCVASTLSRSTHQTLPVILDAPGGVVCCSNSLAEQSHSLSALASSDVALILDLTAIIALEHIGMLRDGTLSNRTLMVAQRTIDELTAEALKVQDPPPDGQMQIGLEEGLLVRYVVTAEQLRSVHQYFIDLVKWLRENARIVSIAPSVAEKLSAFEDMGTMIGQSFWDSIRASASNGGVLVSDDLWLRSLAKTSLNVDGACCAVLLMSEAHAGRLARSRYSESIARLIARGYRFLPVDSAILEAAARLDDWQVGDALRKALLSVHGPAMMTETALLAVTQFIREVWLTVADIEQRTSILVSVMEALVVGRGRIVLKWFRASIRFPLVLHPSARDEVIRIVTAWESTRVFQA